MSAFVVTTATTLAGFTIRVRRYADGSVVLACAKCQGTGHVTHFAYHDEGVCYTCQGRGVSSKAKRFADEAALIADLELKAKRREASRKSRAKKEEAQRLVNLAAWEAEQEVEKAAAAAREAKLQEQAHLTGEIGERVAFSGVVKLTRSFSGNYGPSLLVVVSLEGGSEVKFFSTANFAWELNEGDQVSLTGEISGFDSYGDSKQTVVKKAKIA
jgi:hypothetical protein